MKDYHKLLITKALHTIIWFVMAMASVYILYAGLTKTVSVWLWIAIAMLTAESLVLIFNDWTCPLTPIARKYTAKNSDNFDIYLPKIIAKYNKIIFGTIFVVGLFLVIYNLSTT